METPPQPPPDQTPPTESTPEPPPSISQSTELPQPPIEPQTQPPLQDPPPPSSTEPPTPTPAPSSTPLNTTLQQRASTPFNRPWQQPQSSTFTHFSLPPPTPASSPSLATSSSQIPVPRGGMAIGVPAPIPPPTSAFNTPPFGLNRNVPDTMPTSTTSQVRPPIQGMGIMGSLGASSAVRPTGVPGHQLRPPMQSAVGPSSGLNMQSPATQTFQGHGMFRGQSLGPSAGSSSANTGQTLHPQNQPWLSSAAHGKSPLPPPSIRPQINPQSVQQRAHIPQQKQQTISTTMQQQQTPSQVKQIPNPSQPPEQLPQQYPPPRAQLPVPQQMGKSHGLGIQKSSSLGVMQAGADHSDPPNKTSIEEPEETCNRILSKRTIHELVNQIDPSENLEPEVEDILVDIAEEFVESITTFGCSLAKHRKSSVLEAKDILLHVERNWNMTLPGFSGDEIKIFKKPLTNDLHKERLAVIKKSIVASESTNTKNSAGQASGGNPKSHSAKGPVIGSPNT